MNPHAAALLYVLAADGRTSSPALADALSMHKSAIRPYLAHLRGTGMVVSDLVPANGDPGGATRYYTATAAGIAWARREQCAA